MFIVQNTVDWPLRHYGTVAIKTGQDCVVATLKVVQQAVCAGRGSWAFQVPPPRPKG